MMQDVSQSLSPALILNSPSHDIPNFKKPGSFNYARVVKLLYHCDESVTDIIYISLDLYL